MTEPEYLAAVEIDEPLEDPDPGPEQINGWVEAHEFGLQVIGSMEEPEDDYLFTYDDWWQEFWDNSCHSSPQEAAADLCGCRGSGALPSGMSRLLKRHDEADYFFDDGGYP